MKNLIAVIIFAVIAVGLSIALLTTNKRAANEKQKATETITSFSNQWVKTEKNFTEQQQVNVMLSNDLTTARTEIETVSNQLAGKLADVSATLEKTEASLKATKEELAQRDAKISDLEKQNQELDLRAADLSTSITNLTGQIAETRRKLAASEGDKAFLEKELKRLMSEKAELERQFNDIDLLRKQVAKLREEMNISRRLEWIRKGLWTDEEKGAQKLMAKGPLAPAPSTNRYDLNVEVNADGSVRVIPPLTNAPANSAQ